MALVIDGNIMNNFDDIADDYDKLMTAIMTPERLDLEATEFVGIEDVPGGKMIDLGCGTGIQCYYYHKHFPQLEQIVGLDISSAAIDIANERHSAKNVTYKVGDFHNIPYSDDTFDFVYSRFATHYSDDMPRAMREIARITKPGGYIFIHVVHPLFELFNKPSRDYHKHEEATFKPIAKTSIQMEHVTHTIEEYINALVNAGLHLESIVERNGERSGETEYRIPTVLLLRIRKSE
jgi:ubiquinone/menaquinone biosynthesis C-methylase UbiE